MSHLTYLVNEVCAGVEIYFTGRTGGQYFKTAFILCDDYTELASKLFLRTHDRRWSDRRGTGAWKSYRDVQAEVQAAFAVAHPADLPKLRELHERMQTRRERRNQFFHSTHLLDLITHPRECIDAFCDLFDYGTILFPTQWEREVEAARDLGTYEVLLRLERLAFSDTSITSKVQRILAAWPRTISKAARRGSEVASYPEDLHLRLCVTYGRRTLRDKLRVLLTS